MKNNLLREITMLQYANKVTWNKSAVFTII